MMNRKSLIAILSLAVLGVVPAVYSANPELHLKIGDPDRKNQEIDLILDAIVDTRTGEQIVPARLAEQLADKKIVFVGESHTDMNFHRAQLRVIQELHRAGRDVLIGLEMYPYTLQSHLDAWIGEEYTEQSFLEESDWYDSWGYHWDYYRDIFMFARENGIGMYGINVPREVITAVRKKGYDALSEEDAAHIPVDVDVESEEHMQLFKSYFEEEGETSAHAMMPEEQWLAMLRAQATWDATMGHNAVQVLEEHGGGPETVLVILVGSGHAVYDLGIQRQIANWQDLPMAALIPIPVRDEDCKEIEMVQASYADYLWGMPAETDPIYPASGVGTKEVEGEDYRKVIHISEESPAEYAGFKMGDLILAMDGVGNPGTSTVRRMMSEKRWGDELLFKVRRGEETLDLTVQLRRERMDCDEEDESAEGVEEAEEGEHAEGAEETGEGEHSEEASQ